MHVERYGHGGAPVVLVHGFGTCAFLWRNIGPEIRVSVPTTNRSPPSTRAAARPNDRTSSGVSSVLATPRTPSDP